MYESDELAEIRDAVVLERNGDLNLIRDEETGEELLRFRRELV
jgi:hypothetical protein